MTHFCVDLAQSTRFDLDQNVVVRECWEDDLQMAKGGVAQVIVSLQEGLRDPPALV